MDISNTLLNWNVKSDDLIHLWSLIRRPGCDVRWYDVMFVCFVDKVFPTILMDCQGKFIRFNQLTIYGGFPKSANKSFSLTCQKGDNSLSVPKKIKQHPVRLMMT